MVLLQLQGQGCRRCLLAPPMLPVILRASGDSSDGRWGTGVVLVFQCGASCAGGEWELSSFFCSMYTFSQRGPSDAEFLGGVCAEFSPTHFLGAKECRVPVRGIVAAQRVLVYGLLSIHLLLDVPSAEVGHHARCDTHGEDLFLVAPSGSAAGRGRR
jgi:hypothetical protein